MARTNPYWSDTRWEDMPPRPRHESPEAKYFLMIDHRVDDAMRYQARDERALYVHLVSQMTKEITQYMLDKHSQELRMGVTGMVVHQHDFARGEQKIQMGVYILTPQEMDELKREIIREYQERQKAHS